jgi:hypothetical protein
MKELRTNPKLLLGELLLLCFWTWFYFEDRGDKRASTWEPKLQLTTIAISILCLMIQVAAIYQKRNKRTKDHQWQT